MLQEVIFKQNLQITKMKNESTLYDSIDKIIKQNYTSNFMNNSKWVKLIELLVKNHKLFDVCNVKLIYDNEIRQLIIEGNETFDFDYYKDSMEGMVTKTITPGWVLYKEIEWISFPSDKGNTHELEKLINQIGEFRSNLTADYFRIFAYFN